MPILCPECNAPLKDVETCREYLDQMIKWDFGDFAGVGQIHHLTVLSYNLQHPSVYSSKGLEHAKESLVQFLKQPDAFAEHDAQNRSSLASDKRDWKIAGTPGDHGEYRQKPAWTIRASDVVQGGLQNYMDNVKKWARSIEKSLTESGNFECYNKSHEKIS